MLGVGEDSEFQYPKILDFQSPTLFKNLKAKHITWPIFTKSYSCIIKFYAGSDPFLQGSIDPSAVLHTFTSYNERFGLVLRRPSSHIFRDI